MLVLRESEGFRSTPTLSPFPSPNFSSRYALIVSSLSPLPLRCHPERSEGSAFSWPVPPFTPQLLALSPKGRPWTLSVTPLESAPAGGPVNIDSKQLTEIVNPLNATLTKKPGGGSFLAASHSSLSTIPFRITSF